MTIKALTISAILGIFLASGQVHAWGSHQNAPEIYIIEGVTPHVHNVPAKPDTWHSHPANPYTNDINHSHPNGQNEHVHNYGTGSGGSSGGTSHIHAGYRYIVCPYPGH